MTPLAEPICHRLPPSRQVVICIHKDSDGMSARRLYLWHDGIAQTRVTPLIQNRKGRHLLMTVAETPNYLLIVSAFD